MTDLGDMLATEHKRLATRGASRYDQRVPDDGAGTDHHEGQDMRFFSNDDTRGEFGVQVIGLPAGMVPADVFGHDCADHENESVAAMLDTKRREIESEIDEITAAMTAEIAKRRAKLDVLDAVPSENPARDGDIIRFVVTMPRNGERQPYTYVGTVADGRFYLTGRDNTPKTWPELVDFLTSGPHRLVKGSFEIVNRPAVESGDATADSEPATSSPS